MKLLGIHSAKGGGKSTFGSLLKHALKEQSLEARVVPFAGPLKEACTAIFGCDSIDNFYGTDDDKNKEATFWKEKLGEEFSTYRKILQTMGTDKFRKMLNENIWVLSFHRRLLSLQKYNDYLIIVDDVRFPNEAEFILRNGGTIIKVDHILRNVSNDPHLSEKPLPADYIKYSWMFDNVQQAQQVAISFAQSEIKNLLDIQL